jgi:rare lipoprotein A
MKRVLAHSLVIVVTMVASMGAQTRPNNPDSKATGKNTVQAHGSKYRSQNPSKRQAARKGLHGKRPYQVGRASWYGKKFHGKKTASGEAYDMFQFTAAHPLLPLGSYVKVTNLHNGRWVIVRVNDRGPVPRSRIIDLSYGAAMMLGLRAEGVGRVRLDLLEPTNLAINSSAMTGMTEVAGLR